MDVRYFQNKDGSSPVEKFIDSLGNKQRSKAFAYLNMLRIAGSELRMPHSRSLTQDLFELRPSSEGVEVRLIYFFWEEATIVVSGFIKKSRKTPHRELSLARKRRHDYVMREVSHEL